MPCSRFRRRRGPKPHLPLFAFEPQLASSRRTPSLLFIGPPLGSCTSLTSTSSAPSCLHPRCASQSETQARATTSTGRLWCAPPFFTPPQTPGPNFLQVPPLPSSLLPFSVLFVCWSCRTLSDYVAAATGREAEAGRAQVRAALWPHGWPPAAVAPFHHSLTVFATSWAVCRRSRQPPAALGDSTWL